LLDSLGEDQNIVQVYYYNAFCNEISENVIYHHLEGG